MKKLFIIGLPLVLAACVFIGCATLGVGGGDPGTLTITGIPEEFNGKFVSFPQRVGRSTKDNEFIASAEDPRGLMGKIEGAVITNGEARLLIFRDAPMGLAPYTGSNTMRVEFCVRDTADSLQERESSLLIVDKEPDFIFNSVTFENGSATVKWDDVFEVGSITITGLPYNTGSVTIVPTLRLEDDRGRPYIPTYSLEGRAVNVTAALNSTVTVKFYRGGERDGYGYTPFNGTANVLLRPGYLFEDVQFRDDKATIDFADRANQ